MALALSGGGSLGLAHIGVLQYFEEHHIPVDAIAGTSMGGLVGGLYATGHSPAEIEAAFAEAVWEDLLRVQPRYEDLPIQARQDRVHYPGDYVLRLGHGLSLPAGLSTAEPLDLFLSRQVLAYSAVEDFSPTPHRRSVASPPSLRTGKPFVSASRQPGPRAARHHVGARNLHSGRVGGPRPWSMAAWWTICPPMSPARWAPTL